MSRRLEKEPRIQVILSESGSDYDNYLRARGIEPYDGSRARGIKYRNGKVEVVIHRDFYLQGGIKPDQL